jgi:AcrR family transcriptional regulator
MDPVRRSEKRAGKRSQILRHAMALVVENGHESLSLRKAAARAGFSPAGVYEYFSGKDEMIEALAAEGLSALADGFKGIPAASGAKESLVAMGLAYVQFAVDQPELFKLVLSGRTSPRRSLDDPIPPGTPYALLFQAVTRAAEAGMLRSAKPSAVEYATYALWTQMHGMATLRVTFLKGFDADFDAMDRSALNALVEGLQS